MGNSSKTNGKAGQREIAGRYLRPVEVDSKVVGWYFDAVNLVNMQSE